MHKKGGGTTADLKVSNIISIFPFASLQVNTIWPIIPRLAEILAVNFVVDFLPWCYKLFDV